MSAIVCRTCGFETSIPAGQEIIACPACGTINSCPQSESDIGDMLRRATAQRLRCDFAHAESSYQYVLRESPDEHEALWGLVQCRYAVEYVRDPRATHAMPIVHAVRARPMLSDPDFREACALAPEDIRAQYCREAEHIDAQMTRIRDLADGNRAFDIFLCHKATHTNGQEGYTEDFMHATQLYMQLDKAGYRVFFAPFAGLAAGESYEAGVYQALRTAKVMLVVCSNADNINSPWVRTEWQRFLEMSHEPGADKHLIPLMYNDLPSRRLPDEFRPLQAIAMGGPDAAGTLMAALKSHLGETAAELQQPTSVPAPQPVQTTLTCAPESHFQTKIMVDGVAITKYTGDSGEVMIPPTIGGKRVVEIGEKAFHGQEALTRLVIPEGVMRIEGNPFAGCKALTAISVAAGNKKYYDCDGVLFSRYKVLICYPAAKTAKHYAIPEGIRTIGLSAFATCTSLTGVEIPAGVTSIGKWAFSRCSSLTSISIPEGVTSIGSAAFGGCISLTSASIPASVTKIEGNPFTNCKALTTISVAAGNDRYMVYDHALISRENELVCYPAGLPVSRYAIPVGVTGIGPSAFCGCNSLTSVSIPAGVMTIGDSAFFGCNSLTSVSIPAGVTDIGNHAFFGCRSLISVNIPVGVTSIRHSAFSDCSSLISVSIPLSVTSIDFSAFSDCSSLTSVSIPLSVTSIGLSAFNGCSSLTSVSIPAGVTSIDDDAFEACPNLTLRVQPNTPAHTYALENGLRFELIAAAPQSR